MKDENNPPQPWMDPALEARIVASVLGETSAFEAAELERLVAANPELALFKRRIEATHGHLRTASQPQNPRLQLSPERRRKLLETIGVPAVAPPEKVRVIASPSPWWSSPLMVRAAACLIMIGLAVALLSSVTEFRQVRQTSNGIADLVVFEQTDEKSSARSRGVVPPASASAPMPTAGADASTASSVPAMGDIPITGGFFKSNNTVAVLGTAEAEKSIISTTDQLRSQNTYTGEAAAGGAPAAALPASTPLEFAKAGERPMKKRSVTAWDDSRPIPQPQPAGTPAPSNEQAVARLSERAQAVAVAQIGEIVTWDGEPFPRPQTKEVIEQKQEPLLPSTDGKPSSPLESSVVQLAQQYAYDSKKDLRERTELQKSRPGDRFPNSDHAGVPTTPSDFETGSAAASSSVAKAKQQEQKAMQVDRDVPQMELQTRLQEKETLVANLEQERKLLEMNAKKLAEGNMLRSAEPSSSKDRTEMQQTLARLSEIQSQIKTNQMKSEVAEALAADKQAAAAMEMPESAGESPDQELITRLQEQETLIGKLQEELGASDGRAGKSNKVARQQPVAGAPMQQAELLNRIQESESIIEKLQSEMDGTKGMAKSFLEKEAPAVRELRADSPEALADAASGIAPAESDSFVYFGTPIKTAEAIDGDKSEELKQLLEDGKDFQENGRFDLAQKRFEQSLYLDNSSAEARDGLAAASAARAKYADSAYNEARSNMVTAVEAGWELPDRKFDVATSTIIDQSKPGQDVAANINRKLDEIIIPRIDFQDVTVEEALDFIRQRAAQLDTGEIDPAKKGVNIGLKLPEGSPESESRITLGLTDIPLRAAIAYVANAANLKPNIQPDAVSVVPLTLATEALITKEYKVPANFFSAASLSPRTDSQAEARKYLESIGVPFPPGAKVHYIAASNKLIVKNTTSAIDLVDSLVDAAVAEPEVKTFGNEIATAKEPFSTFSLHVSDVSFQLAKDALARGTMPDPSRIRAEEFYNAFNYNDPAPGAAEEVACRIEQSAHPFLQQRNLARIAVKVAAAGRAASQPLRLTILLDTSGSMEREDRAASVRRALQSLVSLLGPDDRVTLIGFARTPRLLVENVSGDQGLKLVEAADRTPSQGGTNLEEALALASELALKNRLPNGQNRIVLLTDGAANLGNANPERLAQQIDKTRQQGISFDACGVGAKGLNDEILEALTRKGDGRYYFLNKPEDADEGFARQLAGAFRPAAENVKVQVVFNPSRVASYRLIGFEKHLLEKQDFRNDKVQAAELSAEEAGVALYQIQPLPEGSGEIGEVFVRFRDPATGKMVERSWTIPYDERVPSFDQAAPSLQLAATAALLAERLAGNEQIDLNALAPVLNGLRGRYGEQQRVSELLQMFERVRR